MLIQLNRLNSTSSTLSSDLDFETKTCGFLVSTLSYGSEGLGFCLVMAHFLSILPLDVRANIRIYGCMFLHM